MGGLKEGKRAKRRAVFVVGRNNDGVSIAPKNMGLWWRDGFWRTARRNDHAVVCYDWFHHVSGITLDPGEGLVEITIDIKRAK